MPSVGAMITLVKLRLGISDLALSRLIHCGLGIVAKVEGGGGELHDVSRERLEQLYYGEKLDRQSLLK